MSLTFFQNASLPERIVNNSDELLKQFESITKNLGHHIEVLQTKTGDLNLQEIGFMINSGNTSSANQQVSASTSTTKAMLNWMTRDNEAPVPEMVSGKTFANS